MADLRRQLELAHEVRTSERERVDGQRKLSDLIAKRKADFDLWSYVNTALAETKLKDSANLKNYRPPSHRKEVVEDVTMVQLELNGVTLKQLTALLHEIYSSGNLVALYKLESLKAGHGGKGLDCSLTFLTPKA